MTSNIIYFQPRAATSVNGRGSHGVALGRNGEPPMGMIVLADGVEPGSVAINGKLVDGPVVAKVIDDGQG